MQSYAKHLLIDKICFCFTFLFCFFAFNHSPFDSKAFPLTQSSIFHTNNLFKSSMYNSLSMLFNSVAFLSSTSYFHVVPPSFFSPSFSLQQAAGGNTSTYIFITFSATPAETVHSLCPIFGCFLVVEMSLS